MPNQPRNQLLQALSASGYERLSPQLEQVDLPVRTLMLEAGQPIEWVYFIERGVASLVSLLVDGTAVEIATVGREGMVGLPVFLDAPSMSAQAFMQVPGDGLRLPSSVLRDAVDSMPELRHLLNRFTQATFTFAAQSSACNRKHPVTQRCARWLLLTHDRVENDTFELTQLFLSQMLGVRRASVTEAAGALQRAGLVRYRHGVITITDRAGLEKASCECYAIIRNEFALMLGGETVPDPLSLVKGSADKRKMLGGGL